jgi:hypothetical protein
MDTNKNANDQKAAILAALVAFVGQRGGIDPRNYGSWKDYRQEQRQVTRDAHDFRELLRQVSWRSDVGADELRRAFKAAYSGRLTLEDDGTLSYCTGQYFPTEYRRAACAVLASALWEVTRERLPNDTACDLRLHFRKLFGARIAERYFN